MSPDGTFETCRRTPENVRLSGGDRKSSVYPQNDAIDPFRKSQGGSYLKQPCRQENIAAFRVGVVHVTLRYAPPL